MEDLKLYLARIADALERLAGIRPANIAQLAIDFQQEGQGDKNVTLSPEDVPTVPCVPSQGGTEHATKYRKPFGNRRWTTAEESELINGVAKAVPTRIICQALQRSNKAVRDHISLMRRTGTWPVNLKDVKVL